MTKPIDFIGNEIVVETIFISLETVNTNLAVYSKSVYKRSLDHKWIKFCKDNRLTKRESSSQKWYDMYLLLCAEGIL
jgi:hypothetical protein